MCDKWLFPPKKSRLICHRKKNTSCGLIGAGATERLGNGKPGWDSVGFGRKNMKISTHVRWNWTQQLSISEVWTFLIGSWFHNLQGALHPMWSAGFLPSTVGNPLQMAMNELIFVYRSGREWSNVTNLCFEKGSGSTTKSWWWTTKHGFLKGCTFADDEPQTFESSIPIRSMYGTFT